MIAAEVINNTTWLNFRIQIGHIVLPLLAVYILSESVVHVMQKRTERGKSAGKGIKTLLFTTRSMYILFGIIALISIPLLWWGVIKKLAAMAGEATGNKHF